ncbi:MAG: OmpA family protein [Paludibacteraceae bacterium]|nr:OmpA family protein [Paludibacteraceae bacterium]
MKRIIYIILLAMGLAAVAPMASLVDNNVAAVYAADARAKAKAQREKEKAKLQKAREKAKAKAAKEREKKKKEQAKAAAQKQKAREKAKAQQAKAKQSSASNKQVASKATAPKVDNSLSAAEEKAQYMEQIAAIDKANAKAEAYNNRDITHRLGFWGQVGYSNLFTSGIAFDDKAQTCFQNKDKGFVGGGLGLGYQLRYKQFLMTVGAEFNTYNSIMGISNQPDGSVLRSFGMEPYATTMTYTYNFAKMQDQLIGGFAQVPILFGMELKKLPLFWQAGLKAGIGVWSGSKISGTMTTTIQDNELIDGLVDMYNHSLVTDQDFSRPATSVKWGLNLAATAEIGVNFDQWINASPRLRLSLFADYGFLNALSYKAAAPASAKAQTDLPAQLLATANPLDFPTNSALATSSAANAKVNPFLVGAKIAVWFDLPRQKKYTRDYPKKPTPRMGVYMFDENSALALGGVAVQITNTESGKQMQKNTNRQGLLQGRFAPGEYRISATKNGYFPSDTVLQSVEEFTFDTLRLPLRRIPAPIIYTLCMNVYDEESHEPVEAAARLTALTDTVVLYAAQASDDGFIETPLTEGDYIAHFTAAGYMPKDDTIHFVRDTADIFLRHIKEGIKVKIENLFFATNKTVILPTSEQSMSDLASFLLQNPSVTIHITGHTDAVGSDEANQILSEGRANAVRADLIKRGVAPERMTAEGKGEREHVADNDTEEGRQLNRRVEFTITGTGDEDIQQVF